MNRNKKVMCFLRKVVRAFFNEGSLQVVDGFDVRGFKFTLIIPRSEHSQSFGLRLGQMFQSSWGVSEMSGKDFGLG